jgi:hypothetical protein
MVANGLSERAARASAGGIWSVFVPVDSHRFTPTLTTNNHHLKTSQLSFSFTHSRSFFSCIKSNKKKLEYVLQDVIAFILQTFSEEKKSKLFV